MAREFLAVVKESAFKTAKATPVVWTQATTYGLSNFDMAYVRLADGNAFTMRSRPIKVETPYGGGIATPAYSVSDKQEIKGKLRLKLCVGQAPLFLSWAGVLISGGTSPWTTTEPNGDLPSCTIYHAKTHFDGTVKRTQYSGVKVDGYSLTVSEASTEATLDLDLSAAYQAGNQFDASSDPTATTFPAPADNYFPIDPYVFLHGGGTNYVTFGGSVRTQFTDLTVASQNTLARRYFANRYIQMLRFMGRRTTVAMKNLYTSEADRTAYEGLAAGACSIQLNNGTHGFTFNFNANNILDPVEDDLPLNDLYMLSETSINQWDATAGSDYTITIA
jgi:hypothetical protein